MAKYLAAFGAVVFASLRNSGRMDAGKVAGNRAPLVVALWEAIESAAFPDLDHRKVFEELRDRVTAARNGLIAHLDGQAFEMEHGQTISKSKSLHGAIELDDIRPLYVTVTCLHQSLNKLRAQLKL